jgi:sugar phosphate isomerase/epimerase
MKPRFSCTDFSFPALRHEEALGMIALLGFRGADIGLFEGHGHLKPSCELRRPETSAARLRARLGNRGLVASDLFLQVHAAFDAMAINHPDTSIRTQARSAFGRALDYASALAAEHFTLLPGVAFKGVKRSDSMKLSADELAWRVELGKTRGIRVAVEPHVGSLIDTPERAAALAAMVPGLGLTLDYAHFTRAGIPDSRIAPLLQSATHLHARCARKGRLQCPLKENTIGFQAIIRALAGLRFRGWIALEYVWIDWEHCNEVDVVSETRLLHRHLLETPRP